MTSRTSLNLLNDKNKCDTTDGMRASGGLKNDDADEAAWEAGKGALVGATKWGAFAAVLAGAGYTMSPIYRGLTFQFKVFLQMSGMILGACLEADHRIREYEAQVRMRKRIMRDRVVWESYEKEFEEGSKK